jgi:membrane protease YdiL (CAAX protease family)
MKNARYMSAWVAAMALPYLIVGIFGGGPNAARTLQAGVLLLVLTGIVFGWMIWRGKKVDPEGDEREGFLYLRSMAFSFYVMIIATGTYVLWPVDSAGHGVDASLWLSATLWGSFLAGYVYNRFKH